MKHAVLSLVIFWVVAIGAVAFSATKVNMFLLEPRMFQNDLLGSSLGIWALRSQFSSYAYDGSGADIWTYEISEHMADDLRARCTGSAQIQFYDPRDQFSTNRPLPACVVPMVRATPASRGVEVRLSGTLLQFLRTTDSETVAE